MNSNMTNQLDAIQQVYAFLHENDLKYRKIKTKVLEGGRVAMTVQGWVPCEKYEELLSLADKLGIILHTH